MTTVADIQYNLSVNARGLRQAQRQLRQFAETADRAARSVNRLGREPERAARGIQRTGTAAQRASQQTNTLAQSTARVAAQMRSGNSQVDALVRGLTSTDRATQQAARSQRTLLSTLGGAHRATAQQAQAMARLAQAQAQGVVTGRQAAQQQALIAQRFSTAAVNGRDLRLNMAGINSGMNSLAAAATAAGGPVGRLGAQFSVLASTLGRVNPMLLGAVGILAGAGGLAGAARRAAASVDQIRLAAATAGMGVQEFDDLTFAIQQMAGVTEQRALNAMQRWTRRVGDAADGTGQLAEALEGAGIDLEEFLALDPERQFRAFADAVSEIESAQQRAALVAAAFGAENVAMTSALAEGSDAIDQQTARARELSSGLDEQAVAAQRLQAAQGELGRAVDNVGRQLLTQLIGPMEETYTLFTDVFEVVGDAVEAFGGLEVAVRNVGNTVLNTLPGLRAIERLLRIIGDAEVGGVSDEAKRMKEVNRELQRMVRLRDQAQDFLDDPDPTATEETIRAAERQVEVFERRIRQLRGEMADLADRQTLPAPPETPERPTPTRTRRDHDDTDDAPERDRVDAAERMVQRLQEQNAVLTRQRELVDATESRRRVAIALLETEQELRRDGVDLDSEQAQRALQLTEQVERQRIAHQQAQEAQREQAQEAERLERLERQRAERMERALQDQENRLATVRAEQRLLGETDAVRERELERLRAQHELQRMGVELTSEQGQQYLANAEAIGELNAELRRQQQLLRMVENQATQAFNRFTSGLREGESAWVSFREAALDTLQAVIDELFRVLVVQRMVNQAAGMMFGGGGGGGGFEGVAASVPMGSAKGNAFGPQGHLTQFAKGGVVSSPTLFPFANGVGLMGEAGPEAILPLTRGRGGNLGVQAQGVGGGGDQIVEIIDQRSADSAPVEYEQSEGPNGERTMRVFIRDEVNRMIGEGRTDRSMRANYGVKRRPVKRS